MSILKSHGCILFKSNVTLPSGFITCYCSETKWERQNKGLDDGNKSWLVAFFDYLLLILTFFPFAISVQKIYFYICNKFVIKNKKCLFYLLGPIFLSKLIVMLSPIWFIDALKYNALQSLCASASVVYTAVSSLYYLLSYTVL